jgi:uncharacterized membrane protein
VLLAAFLIRLWHLNLESFWADEGWTMLLSSGPRLTDVVVTMASDQHPPLYFALVHGWVKLAGDSEFAVRLLSAFASLIGVALVYRLAADLFGREAGLLAALVLALTDNDIMLAREARHYAQMALFAIACTLFYFRFLRSLSRLPHRARRVNWSGVGWVLSAAALLYTHYLGGFVLIVQAIHALIFVRPPRRLLHTLVYWALGCATWLPWAYVFLGQSLVRYQRPIIFQSALPNTPDTFSLVRGDLIGYQWGLTGGLLLLGLGYLTYQAGRASMKLRPLLPTVYLALWVGLPIIAIVAINARFPILTTRNFLIVTPAIAILIGHGLTNLDHTAKRLAVAVLVAVNLLTVDAYHLKPPIRQLSQDIVRYRQSDEPVLMDIWVDDFALRYHIGRDLGQAPSQLPLVSLPGWREQYGEGFFATLLAYLGDKPSFWLAYWGQNQDGLLDFFPTHGFTRTATQVELHREERLYIYRYDRAPTEALATFGDAFALLRAEPEIVNGELRVNLLWRAVRGPGIDYSVSVFVLDAGGVPITQHDSSPLDGRNPTSAWGESSVQFDSHRLTLPPTFPATLAEATVAGYSIGVKVYWYADPTPLIVSTQGSIAGADYFRVTSGER